MTVERHPPPALIPYDFASIPDELRDYPNWVCWQWKWARGKWTKKPINPHTGGDGSSTNPATWATFEQAIERYKRHGLPGIGFVFTGTPFTGVDLDDSVDPITHHLRGWAVEIVQALNSYCEWSPSGTGVHIIVRGSLPEGRRKGEIEMYSSGRYFTFTGRHVAGWPTTINDATQALHDLYESIGPQRPSSQAQPCTPFVPSNVTDSEIIERARRAQNGAKFSRLWAGDTTGYTSQSEADLALCSMLAFWTGPDEQQIDRLFRQSGLYRDKWDRADYRASTITHALDRTEFYEPPDAPGTLIWPVGLERIDAPTDSGGRVRPWIIDLSDFLNEAQEPDSWDVVGLFRRQSVNLVVGPPKTFKSFVVQEAALGLASGTAVLGKFACPEPRRVIYVQEESSRSALWRRFHGLLAGRELHPASVAGMLYLVTNENFMLDDVAHLERLIVEGIQAHQADIVILDPLREMHTRNENDAAEMLPILKAMKRIRDQYGVTVIVVHHNNKNPEYDNPADSIRGSTAIWGAMDGGIFVSTTKEKHQMKVEVNLKEGGQAEPFFCVVEGSADEITLQVYDITEKQRTIDDRDILSCLTRFGWSDVTMIGRELSISDRRLRPRLNSLFGRQLIKRKEVPAGRSKKYLYAALETHDDAPDF